MNENGTPQTGKGMFWTGVVMSALPSLMLLMAGTMALLKTDAVVKGMSGQYGYPDSSIQGVGVACLASVILYIIPRTAVLGAILMTGYLGGAVATHVHANEGLMFLGPVLFGALVWGGLFFRDARIRALLPWRK